jgi:alkaline phosphatase D
VKDGVPVPAFPLAATVQQKWAKYRMNLALANLRNARGASGWFNHWDDHEFVDDFALATKGQALYDAGAQAFGDYMPVTRSRSKGIYRTVRWGRDAELFFLDERSFRSPKVSAGHVCDNPQNNVPDLAPTAPQTTRDKFAAIYPPLAQPVSQACLDAIRDPSRTMLGAAQLARFTKAVKASKARWKIVVNEVTMGQEYVFPYDQWEGYEAERQKVLKTLSQVDNAVVLTTDVHATEYNDARFQTLEPGGAKDSGVPELITGPVGTASLKKEFDAATGVAGTAAGLRAAFYKPAPPDGLGMKCAVIDTNSYAQVEVTAKTLTLRPKDENGKPLHEESGGPACGPFKLKAK